MKTLSIFAVVIALFSVQAFARMVIVPPEVRKSSKALLTKVLKSRGETPEGIHVTAYNPKTGLITFRVSVEQKSGNVACWSYVIANIEHKGRIHSALLPEYPIEASCRVLASVTASSSAPANQYLCTQKGKVRPAYLTIDSSEARLIQPPSFRQVVMTKAKPEGLRPGYVAMYRGTISACDPATETKDAETCKARIEQDLMVSPQIANGELQGNARFNGYYMHCSKGTF